MPPRDEQATRKADFRWAFGLNELVLRFMGIWPSNVNCRSWSNVVRMPMMMFVLTFGLLLPELWALKMVFRQFQLLIDNLLTNSPTIAAWFKLLFMWQQAQALEPVVVSSQRDWAAMTDGVSRRPRHLWELDTMRRHAWRARCVTIVDYFIIMCCFAFFVFAPLFGINIRLINNITDYVDERRHLMVQTCYFYDYTKTPLFELTVLVQQMSCLVIAMAVSVPDSYFVGLIMHTSAQYKILGADIENLATGRSSDSERELCSFIDRHVHLNKMVSIIEQSFSAVTAVQVLCMIAMVCCLGFETLQILDPNLTTSSKPTPFQILTLVVMIFYIMLHTMINCMASETLASRSEEIHYNIYNSPWYTMSCAQMRYLVPMMLMSKDPQQIKAGKLLTMSMETYCSIVKTTLGYLSVLIAVTAE